jgi:(2Fe-2S) ferredoxin
MEKLKNIGELRNLRVLLREASRTAKDNLKVCCGLPCSTLGSHAVVRELELEAEKSGLEVDIVKTGCQGFCQRGPLLQVEPYGYFYQKVRPEQAKEIISITCSTGLPVRDLTYRDTFLDSPKEFLKEIPFYSKQVKIALRNTGAIDPFSIHHYIAAGGYSAAEKMFSSMTPDQVLDEVKKANLRGRGGAGFPAGIKWSHAKRAPGRIKMVIANGDEGDPGAFMDRSIMEGDPHSLLEGMLICAYAISAHFGFILCAP